MAQTSGHESAFVVPAQEPNADFALRFFVPAQEVSMCGHATLGTLWLLRRLGIIGDGAWRVQTLSGLVHGRVAGDDVRISQPPAIVERLENGLLRPVLDVLGLSATDTMLPVLYNSTTSRPKTVLQLTTVAALNRLRPQFDAMEKLCERLASTGLYPFALLPAQAGDRNIMLEARQFPRASGYPEDAATGIAATALVGALSFFGIAAPEGMRAEILQGRAMGRTSRILVASEPDGTAWLGGSVTCNARPGLPSWVQEILKT